MAVVGFSFTKINVERKGPIKGKIGIKNNVSIKNIEKTDLALGKAKQNGLKFTFEYSVKYEPKVADIIIEGELVDIQDDKKVEETAKQWKKDKNIDPVLMNGILNVVLTRSNVQALILSRDMGLPPPIPLPKIEMRKEEPATKKGEYIG